MRRIFVCIINLLIVSTVMAQETTTPITYSALLDKAYHQAKKQENVNKSNSVDTVLLPFFDDFSYNAIYPNQKKWVDNKVFINNNFSKQPPSKGVATFDGFNEKGEPYVKTEFGYGVCDTLTSVPIDLNFIAEDSIYLSFFIQPQGYGRQPAINDSLILEFLNLNTGKFVKIKSWPGSKSYAFKQVMIPITQTQYLKRGFQFRFKNKGSMYGADDHWHIDYIKLDRLRNVNDTLVQDISITSNASPLIKPYSAMPWNQFDVNSLADNHFVDIKNNFNIASNVDFTFSSYLNNTKLDSVTKGLFLAAGITSREESKKVNIPVQSGPFSVLTTYRANTNNDFIDINDTLKSRQVFHDYYAYDDGTAEDGYGLTIPVSGNGRFAYMFNAKNLDTLSHVQIHFTQKQVPINNELFTLTIWKSLNPEVIIYQQTSLEPIYIDSLNGFTTYKLDSIVTISGDFYIGWIQSNKFFMNIGLDRNSINSNFMYYKVNANGWQQSSIEGTAMIRPVFADNLITGIRNTKLKSLEFELYPNPGNGKLNVLLNQNSNEQIYHIKCLTLQGQVIYQGSDINAIDLSQLSNGMYIVQILDVKQQILGTKKYIKQD